MLEAAQVSRVPLFSEAAGTVEYRDLEEGETLLSKKVAKLKLVERTVIGPQADQQGDYDHIRKVVGHVDQDTDCRREDRCKDDRQHDQEHHHHMTQEEP